MARKAHSFALALLVTMAGLVFAYVRDHRFTVLTAFLGFWLAYASHFESSEQRSFPFLGVSCGFLLFTGWTWWHLVWERLPHLHAGAFCFRTERGMFTTHSLTMRCTFTSTSG